MATSRLVGQDPEEAIIYSLALDAEILLRSMQRALADPKPLSARGKLRRWHRFVLEHRSQVVFRCSDSISAFGPFVQCFIGCLGLRLLIPFGAGCLDRPILSGDLSRVDAVGERDVVLRIVVLLGC